MGFAAGDGTSVIPDLVVAAAWRAARASAELLEAAGVAVLDPGEFPFPARLSFPQHSPEFGAPLALQAL